MTCGAHLYVGAQLEFCQGRAAHLQPLVRPGHTEGGPARQITAEHGTHGGEPPHEDGVTQRKMPRPPHRVVESTEEKGRYRRGGGVEQLPGPGDSSGDETTKCREPGAEKEVCEKERWVVPDTCLDVVPSDTSKSENPRSQEHEDDRSQKEPHEADEGTDEHGLPA